MLEIRMMLTLGVAVMTLLSLVVAVRPRVGRNVPGRRLASS